MPEKNDLSKRELEILSLVATGASNKEIAQELFISNNTVKVHLRNIFTKLEASSRTEATMWAVRNGLVQPFPEGERTLDIEDGGSAGQQRPWWQQPWLWGLAVLLILAITLAASQLIPGEAEETQVLPEVVEVSAEIRWQPRNKLPEPRAGHAVATYENKIYTIGGDAVGGVSASVQRYDPEADSWNTLMEKNTAVSDIHAAVLGGKIYVPGGRLASGGVTDILEVYDPLTDSWEEAAPIPVALSGYASAAYEGRLYLFGGWDGVYPRNDVYVYTPGDNSTAGDWARLSAMPTSRGFAGAAVSGEKIYIVGGIDEHGDIMDITEIYVPALDENGSDPWSEGIPMPAGRYKMGITSVADLIYIIGGEGEQGSDLSPIQFSPTSVQWQVIDTPFSASWSELGLVPLGTQIYVLGGRLGGEISAQNLAYQAIYTIAIPIVR